MSFLAKLRTEDDPDHGDDVLTAALAYAARGGAVFPCKPDKSPYTVNGWKDATTDPAVIRGWWQRFPGALIGAPVPENRVVLDMDPRHGGRLDDLPDLPHTRTVWSGRGDGGRHFYLTVPPGVVLSQRALEDAIGGRTGRARPGIGWDLRIGGKHYVIVPPSIHPDTGKPYVWDDPAAPFAEMPGWLVGMCTAPARPAPAPPAPALNGHTGTGTGAISRYNADTTISSILTRHGWDLVRGDGESDGSLWRHPTASAAQSASVQGGRLYNYSTSTGLPMAGPREGGLSPFDLTMWLDYRGNQVATVTAVRGDEQLPAPALTAIDEEDADGFWSARPELDHIRTFARARRACPWAVLGVVLARVIAATPRWVVLPPLVGAEASLNTFVGLVAASGGGKGASEACATDAVDVGHIEAAAVGSGEGIAHLFMRRTREGVEQHRESVLMQVAEIDTLAALSARQGATLLPELRKAWSGESLGFGYADPAKALPVGAHQYRLCLVAGVQPGRAQWVLDDANGGTPQRFLWLPAVDPAAPEQAPPCPDRWTWTRPNWPAADFGTSRVTIRVCDTARHTIDQARLARLRGDGEALDGHALLARLKVAAALAILNGHAEVTEDDWALSETIAALSERTRAHVVDHLRREASALNRGKAEAEAERAITVADRQEANATKRACAYVLRKLTAYPDGVSQGDLRRGLSSPQRGALEPALDILTASGQIVSEPSGNGGAGLRWRLA